MRPATSKASWVSVLQTPADSPYSVSLAIRIAWSVLSQRITVRTGPKISSRAIVMSLATGRGDRPVGLLDTALGYGGHEFFHNGAADLEPVGGSTHSPSMSIE